MMRTLNYVFEAAVVALALSAILAGILFSSLALGAGAAAGY